MKGVFITTEEACAQVAATASLSSSYSGINVYTGTDNEDKAAPAIICWAQSSTEDFPLSGIWHVKTSIITKQIAITGSVGEMNTFVGDIQSAFLTGSIETTLSNRVSNYFVYQVLFDSSDSSQDGDTWVHTLDLDIVCTIKP